VIGSLPRCAHNARTNTPRVPGIRVRFSGDARLPGTPGLRFRTIADVTPPTQHDGKYTANAVGWQHPPGFKSPILRHLSSSYARPPSFGELLLSASRTPCVAPVWPSPPSGLISSPRCHLHCRPAVQAPAMPASSHDNDRPAAVRALRGGRASEPLPLARERSLQTKATATRPQETPAPSGVWRGDLCCNGACPAWRRVARQGGRLVSASQAYLRRLILSLPG
jgi:hypothetical protein